jgi:hypothetical protein
MVRHTINSADRRRVCGKGTFLDGNYLTYWVDYIFTFYLFNF